MNVTICKTSLVSQAAGQLLFSDIVVTVPTTMKTNLMRTTKKRLRYLLVKNVLLQNCGLYKARVSFWQKWAFLSSKSDRAGSARCKNTVRKYKTERQRSGHKGVLHCLECDETSWVGEQYVNVCRSGRIYLYTQASTRHIRPPISNDFLASYLRTIL